MSDDLWALSCADVAARVRAGRTSAAEVADSALSRIAAVDGALNAFTLVTAERARASAARIDAKRAAGAELGPLAGVPFAVKNLFDVEGAPTLAGSKINRDRQPAERDATLVQRLEAADAILVGCLNMGEYAYDFTGENAHDGASRNPHDATRMSGGSSGGSATAVASGMASVALASDTNGSIRVPSSFCGLFGLKPTYGRLSRAGTFPFVASLDHLGPIARSPEDLALVYDALQGQDPADHAQAHRAIEPTLPSLKEGLDSVRIATLDGWFAKGAEPIAYAATARVAQVLSATRSVTFADAELARAAAFLITMSEGGALHAGRLRTRRGEFDPDVRDRLIAGAILPSAWIVRAHKVRARARAAALKLFEEVDLLLAPATPRQAPKIGQKTMILDGIEMAVRPNLGAFTQPISCIGLPVAVAPIWLDGESLPIGVQIIGPPWREDLVLRAAHALYEAGAASAPIGAGGSS